MKSALCIILLLVACGAARSIGFERRHEPEIVLQVRSKDGPASAELRAIAKVDQADRTFTKPPTAEEWKPVEARDRARRDRVLELLKSEKLVTGDDFDTAALIFQHGDTPDDFLTAHELAAVGGMLGHVGNLAALAEDRFLTKIGKIQRVGSQFHFAIDGAAVLNPVDDGKPDSVTDALRRDLFMPTPTEYRRDGLNANSTAFPAMSARVEQRTNAKWILEQARRPVSRELAHLAAKPTPKGAKRVLAIYRSDQLSTPRDYFHAAVVLYAAGDPASLLPHELALVAAARGYLPARRLFAETLDRYLVSVGRLPRYGTAHLNGVNPPGHAAPSAGLTGAVKSRLDVTASARVELIDKDH